MMIFDEYEKNMNIFFVWWASQNNEVHERKISLVACLCLFGLDCVQRRDREKNKSLKWQEKGFFLWTEKFENELFFCVLWYWNGMRCGGGCTIRYRTIGMYISFVVSSISHFHSLKSFVFLIQKEIVLRCCHCCALCWLTMQGWNYMFCSLVFVVVIHDLVQVAGTSCKYIPFHCRYFRRKANR